MDNLWVIFLTGLTVGGLTCLAVQGGLLASVIAAKEEEEIQSGVNRKSTIFPILAFVLAKLSAYTIFGFILGAFGGAISINQSTQNIIQILAGTYMILIALNLLDVHPIFRYAVIQPPRFLTRMIRNRSRSQDLYAPALLGMMTIFIPCGTTLAIEALAIASGNPLTGATTMFAFILGTTPVFFGIGWLTSIFGDRYRTKFLRFAAFAIIFLGISSVNGALVSAGSPITLPSIQIDLSDNQSADTDIQVNQNPTIIITSGGYSPNYLKVNAGQPVNLNLQSKGAYSCALAFRIPSLGVSQNLQPNDQKIITFTPPKGKTSFSCSMGMYTGVIEAI